MRNDVQGALHKGVRALQITGRISLLRAIEYTAQHGEAHTKSKLRHNTRL